MAVVCVLGMSVSFAQDSPPAKPAVEFFVSASCHLCHEVRTGVIQPLQEKYAGRVDFIFRDISDTENLTLLLALKEQFGLPEDATVPIVSLGSTVLVGKAKIGESLPGLIEVELGRAKGFALKPREGADPVRHFFTFTPLAILAAGLIDGINPCAFTVIVFFMSFLALQGFGRRQLLVIGLAFIVSVFLTYVMLGLGIFGFLYAASGFWVVRKLATVGVGIVSMALGVFAVYDIILYARTKDTRGMSLQLPPAVKARIQKVIARRHRKTGSPAPGAGSGVGSLVATAFVTGFLVSLLEAVCTGQMYLPTISFVLKTTAVKARALAYLLLYNAMFVVPLFIIFLCALLGATSGDFARFMKKHMLTVKVLMAFLFFGLGAFLIWRG